MYIQKLKLKATIDAHRLALQEEIDEARRDLESAQARLQALDEAPAEPAVGMPVRLCTRSQHPAPWSQACETVVTITGLKLQEDSQSGVMVGFEHDGRTHWLDLSWFAAVEESEVAA